MKRTYMMAAGALAFTLAVGGSVWADRYVSAAEEPQSQETTAPQAPFGEKPMHKGMDMKKGGFKGGKGMHFMTASEELVNLLGLTADEIREALKSGTSLSDLAAKQGVDAQAVIDLIVAEMTKAIDERLAAGAITQEHADEHKAELTEKVTQMVNGKMIPKENVRGGVPMFASEELTNLLGLASDELRTELQAGKSLADIANEQGIDVQQVIDLLVQGMNEKLDEQLANGNITQERYDSVKAQMIEKTTDMVNGEFVGKGGLKGVHFGHRERGFTPPVEDHPAAPASDEPSA